MGTTQQTLVTQEELKHESVLQGLTDPDDKKTMEEMVEKQPKTLEGVSAGVVQNISNNTPAPLPYQNQNAQANIAKFNTLVKKNSSKTLLKIKSGKPLDFFPDEVVIETNKVNVSQRDYFFMRRLHTIAIEDIEDVFVETTPIFATLSIVDKGFVENTVKVPFLFKKDAKKARRIIQGLVTAFKEKVDIASLPDDELVEKLEILGSAGEVEDVSATS